jgi:2,3-diaminopropionate biosynthesis protein SbnA
VSDIVSKPSRPDAGPHVRDRDFSRKAGRRAKVAAPVEGILGAIGATPLVRMRRYLDSTVKVWAKLESRNPGGSSKDRAAARMLADGIASGRVRPETTIVESSSGNMAIGLAQACRYHGLRLICVLDERANRSTVGTLRALGSEVRIVTEPDPETGDLLRARLNLVARLVEQIPDSFWPNQYANPSNPDAHSDGTMREIDEALDGRVDHLLVAAGTAGTLRGCSEYLRDHGRATKLIGVDSEGSALFGGKPGTRRLPGAGSGVPSRHSVEVELDRLELVSDLDCVVGCRRLANREGIFAGASSGGVAIALERIAPTLAPGAHCAIILPDGGSGYLDTVYDDAWVERELGCGPDRLKRLIDPH